MLRPVLSEREWTRGSEPSRRMSDFIKIRLGQVLFPKNDKLEASLAYNSLPLESWLLCSLLGISATWL